MILFHTQQVGKNFTVWPCRSGRLGSINWFSHFEPANPIPKDTL
jgi:hypothetical protein